jgi:predicted phage-related endonuclease
MNAPPPILGDPDFEFRSTHVGASECAALFDCSPYLTRFELWHRRKGNIDSPDLSGVERVEWGLRLEPAIIAAAADRWATSSRKRRGGCRTARARRPPRSARH